MVIGYATARREPNERKEHGQGRIADLIRRSISPGATSSESQDFRYASARSPDYLVCGDEDGALLAILVESEFWDQRDARSKSPVEMSDDQQG